jgi:hypothetical protein
MTLRDQLVRVATAYCAAMRLSQARVSTLVFGDGKKLDSLVDGRADLATGTYERAMKWFSENWPEHTDWPVESDRPVPLSPDTTPAQETVGAGS